MKNASLDYRNVVNHYYNKSIVLLFVVPKDDVISPAKLVNTFNCNS